MSVEPIPDTKDWTWVLARPCQDCGFDAGTIAPADVAARLLGAVPVWQDVLAGVDAARRPAPAVWSPLEYGCHVRDVCLLFAERLDLMLTEDEPTFANWDQDETAVAGRYGEQDPAMVATDLAAAAERLADRFAAVRDPAWQRTGRRGDGARFTVSTFAKYFLHDVLHHVHDVTGRRTA